MRRIFRGPEGFLKGDVAGKLFIEMSTLQPMTGRELAPVVESVGGRLIELPVLGTIPQVKEGKLFALVGGRSEDLDRARPVLEKMTRRIAHMGPNGSGYAMKLAVNLGLGAYIQALAESLALGAKHGLTLDQMLDVLQEAPYASGWMKSKIGVMKGDKPEMTLDIRTLRKDIMSAIATGRIKRSADAVDGWHARPRYPQQWPMATAAAISRKYRNSCARLWCRISNDAHQKS